jgi:hypothetical protein
MNTKLFLKLIRKNWILILVISLVIISIYMGMNHFNDIVEYFTDKRESLHKNLINKMSFVMNSQKKGININEHNSTTHTLMDSTKDALMPLEECDNAKRSCDFVKGSDCVSCINVGTGNIDKMTNIKNPKCPLGTCLVKNPGQCFRMSKTIQCSQIISPFNIIGTDCHYMFYSPSFGKGVYMNDNKPVANMLNKQFEENNNDCRLNEINEENIYLLMPPMNSREDVAFWLKNNVSHSEFYDPCSSELNNDEITSDCANQLYTQYNGKENGTLNPMKPGNMILINKEFNGSVKDFEEYLISLQFKK